MPVSLILPSKRLTEGMEQETMEDLEIFGPNNPCPILQCDS